MPVADEVLARARAGDPRALEAALAEFYPAVVRMARALAGSDAVAARVAGMVMRRALQVMPQWRPGTVPENWFSHHTVLAAREAATAPPDPRSDVLLETTPPASAGPATMTYPAFLRAIRHLPPQQREAFLLHHGEKLNPRLLGVAMDCSTAAADNHLRAATESLATMAGGNPGALAARLSRAYATLTPAEGAAPPAAATAVRQWLRPRLLRRWARRVVLLLLVIAVAAAAWYERGRVARFIP